MNEASSHTPDRPGILTINGGSSSIKFARFQMHPTPQRNLHGKVDRIGLSDTNLSFHDLARNEHDQLPLDAVNHQSAANALIDWLEQHVGFDTVHAVGHRVVHGMEHSAPERITRELLDELHRIRPYDPDHLPREIELIEAFGRRHPQLPQVACFDTAFHRTMPRVARLLPLPRRFEDQGLQRYGFHGLSYRYLLEELRRVAGDIAADGRVILAHLGNGASLAAVHQGRSLDTTMGFTPTAGLPMGTRTGDLDPGVAWYLMQREQLTPQQFNHLINHESGLLGISETSSDMRDLQAREADDPRAAEAVACFCYQTRKWLGAFAAALGGLDTLVFAGGIGENSPVIRTRICAELGFLGIQLDAQRNAANAPLISTDTSRAAVRVIRTDEEVIIAKIVSRLLEESNKPPTA